MLKGYIPSGAQESWFCNPKVFCEQGKVFFVPLILYHIHLDLQIVPMATLSLPLFQNSLSIFLGLFSVLLIQFSRTLNQLIAI